MRSRAPFLYFRISSPRTFLAAHSSSVDSLRWFRMALRTLPCMQRGSLSSPSSFFPCVDCVWSIMHATYCSSCLIMSRPVCSLTLASACSWSAIFARLSAASFPIDGGSLAPVWALTCLMVVRAPFFVLASFAPPAALR